MFLSKILEGDVEEEGGGEGGVEGVGGEGGGGGGEGGV